MSPGSREFQDEVARVALAVARDHGFALAGGNALAVHGIISRPTEDVDLFAPGDRAVQAAAGLVAAALAEAGFTAADVTSGSDLAEAFDGFERDMTEFEVARGGQAVRLQLVRFHRSRPAVMMDIGPVLHLDDLLGTKVSAMATRAEPRDYMDVAAALRTYDRRHLLKLASRADPDLVDEEFTEAMRRLDQLPDYVFREQPYQLTPAEIRDLRAAFSDWPR
jgi:predicted nucleotidyltransferase component of viral defense system